MTGPPHLRVLRGGRGARDRDGLLVTGAAEIVTAQGGLRRGDQAGEIGVLRAATPRGGGLSVAAWNGRIVAVGTGDAVGAAVTAAGIDPHELAHLDAAGGTITPGLIDAHTHLLFAGDRAREIVMRQRGADYLGILAAGGGILSTVAATRAASDDELLEHGRRWLAAMLRAGATTVEAKSGYGLDAESELRLLALYSRLNLDGPVEIVPTFLGAHAVPPELRGRPDAADGYVAQIMEEQLPRVAAQGVATSCDVFCEAGVFDTAQSRAILQAARRHGLSVRLHADQLEPSGGAQLATEIGALSADHLSAIADDGIAALAAAADAEHPVIATLLPATGLYLRGERAPARTLIERGIPIALGTDFNPGTSPAPGMGMALSLGCLLLELTPAEALAAATVNAAHALGLGETHGSLEPSRVADLVVWDVPRHDLIPYWLGADLVRAVVKRGRVVHPAA